MATEEVPPAGVESFVELAASLNGKPYRLCLETWTPEAGAKKNIKLIYLEGVNESADTLSVRRLAAAYVQQGVTFVCLEHHGHGRSVGPKDTLGLVDSFAVLKEHVLEVVKRTITEGEVFGIIGHSLGGAVAAYVGDDLQKLYGQPKFIGAVLVCPALGGYGPSALVKGALRLVAKVLPSFPIGPPEDTSLYSTHSGKGLNYSGKMRARTALILLDIFDQCKKELKLADSEKRELMMDYPLLYAQGERDGVVPLSVGKAFFEFAKSSNKEFLAMPNQSHQPFVDKDWQVPIEAIISWTTKQTASVS